MSHTIVIPRADPQLEKYARELAEINAAQAEIKTKTKTMKARKTFLEASLRGWLVEKQAPIDIQVPLGNGLSATLQEGESTERLSDDLMLRGIKAYYLEDGTVSVADAEASAEAIKEKILSMRKKTVTKRLKFSDAIQAAEAKRRRAEDKASAIANGTYKAPASKKRKVAAAAAAAEEEEDEEDDDDDE